MLYRCPHSWCERCFEDRRQLFNHTRRCIQTRRVLLGPASQNEAQPAATGDATASLPQSSCIGSPGGTEAPTSATDSPMADGTLDDYEAQHLAFMEECHQNQAASQRSTSGLTEEVMSFLMRALSGQCKSLSLQLSWLTSPMVPYSVCASHSKLYYMIVLLSAACLHRQGICRAVKGLPASCLGGPPHS